jgi:peptide/nickel transport system substrate-binding protein
MVFRTLKPGRATAVAVGLVVLAVTGCGSSGGSSASSSANTTATFAEGPGATPNYIFPLASLEYFSVTNLSQFQYLMYRPLYWFGENGAVTLNNSLSLANPPVYSSDGKTVTITLKKYDWSDGQQVTTRDIAFWLNLQIVEKANWAGYSPGEWPDNLVGATSSPPDLSSAYTIDSPTQITLHLTQTYGSYFFTYNELSQISPIPQHIWDVESAGGKVGNYDETVAGAQAVYKFLASQSTKLGTYATNPLWKVVDGPWKLTAFDPDGACSFVPNPNYSGPVKAKLTKFSELPFTTDTAEFDELNSASSNIDYGYLPAQDTPQKSHLTSEGYTFTPWTGWEITYFPENFNNPTVGPIFKQLYFRQAMQDLVDQSAYISAALNGYGYATYGPVPVKPTSDFVTSVETNNPYPFSVSNAAALLKANGWTVNAGGVSTCTDPGTGAGQCGAGVTADAQASFNLQYLSGNAALTTEMTIFKTDFAGAGIQINLSTAPFDTVISAATPCSGSSCTWQMEFWGGGWIFSPDYYPTGDEIFSTGAGSNSGSYSDPTNDANTLASEATNSVSALDTYENYLAKQLPVIWMPAAYSQLSEVKSGLEGTTPQDPLLDIYPENWYWKS